MSSPAPTTKELDQSRASEVTTVIILLPTLAAVTLALRLYTRVVLVKKNLLEDYIISAECSVHCLFRVPGYLQDSEAHRVDIFLLAVLHGFGRHIETVSQAELTEQLKVAVPGIFFYQLTHLFVKLSIMLQYLRISVMPFEKRLCYAMIAILIAQSIATIVVQFVICTPFEALWNPHLPGARCLDRSTVYTAVLGLIIAMDISILVAPVFILRHLTLRWHQKLGISVILSFGGVACIFSILRLTAVPASTKSTDIAYYKANSAIYGNTEPNVGIICACVVTLRPLFSRYLPFVTRSLDGLGAGIATMSTWKSLDGVDTDRQDARANYREALELEGGVSHGGSEGSKQRSEVQGSEASR